MRGYGRQCVSESFFVKIDVMELRSRLSNLQHRALTNGDVFEWLLDHGFDITGTGWSASAAAMNLLKHGEIILSERIA